MPNDEPRWDAAGFTNVSTGQLGKPLSATSVLAPKVIEISADGDWLVWRGGPDAYTDSQPGPGMLNAFVRLDHASPAAIVRFAKRWGVFGLAKATRTEAVSDRTRRWRPADVFWFRNTRWSVRTEQWFLFYRRKTREPVAFWQGLATKFRAALNVAACVNRGRVPDRLDLFGLGVDDDEFELKNDDPFGYARYVLHLFVNHWLHVADVGLVLTCKRAFHEPGWRVDFAYAGHGLLGALFLQLMVTIAGAGGLYCKR